MKGEKTMPIVRLPQGELRDEVRQPLFDTITVAAAEGPEALRTFFSTVTGKTLIETNMKQPGALETAVSFRAMGACLDAQNIYEANQGLLPLYLERSSVELQVGEKVYWQGPARLAAGRVWQHAASAAAPVVLQQYGFSAVQPIIWEGHHVVDINPLQSFAVRLRTGSMTAAEIALATPAANTRVHFVFSLKGLLRRPVQ